MPSTLRTKRTCLVGSALAAVIALQAGPTWASKTFPARIRKDLSLEIEPDCILCHETEEGEKNTVTRPFGVSMRKNGLLAGNLGSLDVALRALDSNGTDSDRDGVPDIEELQNDRNPNAREVVVVSDAGDDLDAAPPVIIELPPPPGPPLMETGCTVAQKPGSPCGRVDSALFELGVVVLSAVRRRKRLRFGLSPAARHSH